jgi:hypothetical protein
VPVGHDLEILLIGQGGYLGRFVLATCDGARPSLPQRLAAVTLADRAAAALVRHRGAALSD